ncbi:MAG: beta-ketoacyl synthase N-terminal-like domain-containing protein [Nitrospirales bacterium]
MGKLAVIASGMVTAVGFNARASCAAMRAGISGVAVVNLWDSESGEYIKGAKVPLPQWWEGVGKLVDLVAPAIQECLRAASPIPSDEIPIFLGVAPANRPFRFENLEAEFFDEIEYKLKVGHHQKSQIIPDGRLAGAVGIEKAQHLLESGEASCCIVAGVDSFLQQDVAEAFMEQQRILTPSNSDGFIPGEAGSAILLQRSEHSKNKELQICGIGFAKESGTIQGERPVTGEGLTQALRTAITQAGIQFSDADYWLNDQNGEHYKFKEAAFAQIRLERIREKPREDRFEVWHPIECLGDIGAAIVPCLLGYALDAHRLSYAPGPLALLHVGSDEGLRAALVLQWKMKDH